MYKITLKEMPWEREYANNGQHAQQKAAYTLLGVYQKADNKPFYAGGDVGTMQVKSARASICKGTDIRAHVKADSATCYGYVIKDFKTMYVMTPEEYIEFIDKYAYVGRDSSKARSASGGGSNGGGVKLALKTCAENAEMYRWFEGRL